MWKNAKAAVIFGLVWLAPLSSACCSMPTEESRNQCTPIYPCDATRTETRCDGVALRLPNGPDCYATDSAFLCERGGPAGGGYGAPTCAVCAAAEVCE